MGNAKYPKPVSPLIPVLLSAALGGLVYASEPQASKRCEWGSPCWFEKWDEWFSRPVPPVSHIYRSSSEITELSKHYTVSIDLPGVDKKDIKAEVLGDRIYVTGERKDLKESKEKSIRNYSGFKHSFPLPEDADVNAIEAKAENGVLKITIPKIPGKKTAKSIPIK